MHTILRRQRPGTQTLLPAIPTDKFMKLHPRHLLLLLSMAWKPQRVRNRWVGGGATSDQRNGTRRGHFRMSFPAGGSLAEPGEKPGARNPSASPKRGVVLEV